MRWRQGTFLWRSTTDLEAHARRARRRHGGQADLQIRHCDRARSALVHQQVVISGLDHVTVVVTDLGAAIRFFELFGFQEEASTVIAGAPFAAFLGVDELEADHVILAVPGLSPRFEIQLMRFHSPAAQSDPHATRLDKIGYNHICFAVDDAPSLVAHLGAHGVTVRGELKGFYNRHLYFVTGPDGITIELSQAQSTHA